MYPIFQGNIFQGQISKAQFPRSNFQSPISKAQFPMPDFHGPISKAQFLSPISNLPANQAKRDYLWEQDISTAWESLKQTKSNNYTLKITYSFNYKKGE